MSKISICREHSGGLDSARAAADQIAEEMTQKFGVRCRWNGDTLAFAHTAVKGEIQVTDEVIEVDAKLGLLASPLKGALESKIHQYIDEYLT
ncbi:MAG: polyhydroxyalkanoic acid system family protein [Lysobacterales bacterium]